MSTGSRQSHFGWSLAAAFSLATLVGCGSGGGPRGGSHISPPATSDAYAALSWQILDVGDSTRTPLTCDQVAGYGFSVSLIDSYGNYYDGAATANCPSSAYSFSATTFYVPAGMYSVEFYLYGDPAVYTTSNTVIGSYRLDNVRLMPGFNDFTGSPQATFVESFVVGWALYSGGRLAACNPGEIIELEFRNPGSSIWIYNDFDCSVQSAGTSFPIPVDYRSAEWNLYLLDANGQTLGSVQGGTVAVPEGVDVNLGTHSFYVHH